MAKKNKRPGVPALPKNPKPLMKKDVEDIEGTVDEPVVEPKGKPKVVAKADLKPAKEPKDPAAVTIPDEVMDEIRHRAHATVKSYSNRTCACGCMQPTKSTFAPGHDAKLLSQLIEAGKREYLEAHTKANGKVAKSA